MIQAAAKIRGRSMAHSLCWNDPQRFIRPGSRYVQTEEVVTRHGILQGPSDPKDGGPTIQEFPAADSGCTLPRAPSIPVKSFMFVGSHATCG